MNVCDVCRSDEDLLEIEVLVIDYQDRSPGNDRKMLVAMDLCGLCRVALTLGNWLELATRAKVVGYDMRPDGGKQWWADEAKMKAASKDVSE